ncbi:retron Ec78 anti-phage system effector HNH endonuclease PtuB [Aliivibrio fischeri]|uniref:retron Ec78 anti-phage system effector HNH endonuclease PtuB n=1 Tax=Aliivibrio fischeri TaxID=668 RepID=UPI00080DBCAF|nr:retron Ec78 anti-phage system effector HNH endonuclease PtuB [Aliivibrio fischeri]OCH42463.1 TIGR02646 family protein [Aliivibrio fischeri]
MRRIDKSHTPNVLTIYAAKNPEGDWVSFQRNNSKAYQAIKTQIFDEQGDICAYCEISLSKEHTFEHHRRIEHFNSKSGWKVGQAQPNWHLDWYNVIGVCIGGTDRNNLERFVIPDNKSCDSYKEHLETNCGYGKNWKGKVVSPLEVELCSDMFQYCMASGNLIVDETFANSVQFKDNVYATSAELLQRTLVSFNLNCDRLNLARMSVHHSYEKLKAEFRKSKDVDRFKFKLRKWSGSEKVRSFQTTRDILLRQCPIAKKCLKSTSGL